ncbi:hypothetical protein [Actinomadura gamaensis]|uniref:Uncharacterized protein n=1 Tax=Actinomadura gamaensis TaxID=1763541 RepID=A0ABV9U2R7_9ACTN
MTRAPDGPFAEATEVWPRGGRITIIGELDGADGTSGRWSLLVVPRPKRPRGFARRVHYRLLGARRPLHLAADVRGRTFEAAVPARLLAPLRRRGHWDLYLVAEDGTGPLRVGRWLDDMPGKRHIVTFPPVRTRRTAVRPYFTETEALSIRTVAAR